MTNLNTDIKPKQDRGVTLIELLVVLVMSGILIGALYRVFISQQKSYTVQEQVSDMQQNIRAAMDRMSTEIRMAGYGSKNLDAFGGSINGFTGIIKPEGNSKLTIIMAFEVGLLLNDPKVDKGSYKLNVANAGEFDNNKKKYLCISGDNNYVVGSVFGNTITLTTPLKEGHLKGEPVFLVKAITYDLGTINDGKPVLRRNENTGGEVEPLADNIESLQFTYFDANDNVTPNLPLIRKIRVTVTARTDRVDPEYQGSDGYRNRSLFSDVMVRNM